MIDALAARILLASSPVVDCLRADSPSEQRSRVSRDVISNATEFCPRTVRGTLYVLLRLEDHCGRCNLLFYGVLLNRVNVREHGQLIAGNLPEWGNARDKVVNV